MTDQIAPSTTTHHETPAEADTGAAPAAPAERTAQGLRLTKLTLNGFKSFADKTIFTFDQPITCVVGPNGCGKSNIVDAIKWVLGERSSKNLRGKEMIDVIFAGSAARKPAGMASVTLTFDNPAGGHAATAIVTEGEPADDGPQNSDPESEVVLDDRRRIRRPLPLDADEVSVERQLYRDGTSRYLINGKRARLRDIRELFLDTGIGADAYSIIEQGKVDAMLLASPMDRRTIFEEAAGIAKYKQRRIESQRKLARAEANLMLTREQLESTERRLRIVRGQAAKARRFKELDNERAALRLAVAFDQYDEICVGLEAMTSRLQGLEAERRRTQEEVAEAESALQQSELAHAEAVADLRRAENAIREAEHESSSAVQRREMAERSIDEARRQLELDLSRLETATQQIGSLESDIEDQRADLAALAERVADAERALEQATRARAEAMASIADTSREREQARSALAGMQREQGTLEAEAQSLAHRLEELAAQRESAGTKIEEIKADLEHAERERADADHRLRSIHEKIARLEHDLDSLKDRGDTLEGARRERASLVERLTRERVGLDARRATLEEMVRTRAGLAEAARWVMQRRDEGEGFAGVIAPLAELVETDTDHAAAVEAALGADLQAIVTRSAADIPAPAERAALPGRVRFIPLRSLGGSDEQTDPPASLVGVFPASRLVPLRPLVRPHDGAPETAALLDRLLSRTYLVDDLDAALLLAAGGLPGGARFVTRTGEVLDRRGDVDAGPSGTEQGRGLLRHAAELAELETTLAEITARFEAERDELARLDRAWADLNTQRERVADELAGQQRDLAAEQARADRLDADIARLGRERDAARDEIARLDARAAELEEAKGSKLERARSLTGLIDEQRAKAESLDERLEALRADANKETERMSAAREQAAQAGALLDAARRELERLEHALETARGSVAEYERHAAAARERLERHERVIAEADTVLERAEQTLADLRGGLDGLKQRVESTDADRAARAEALRQSRDRARLVERDWHGVEASRRELEVKRENLEERTSEDLRVDLANEYLDYRAVMAPGDVARVDIPDAQARINVLRGEIKKLGNVNLDSIEEEGQLAEADEQLRAQLDDLDDARQRLTDLIDRLNNASRERFAEVFGLIREHFGGRDGMFRRLFGGGRAEVRLMGLVKEVEEPDGTTRKVVTDETDLLESGIEVIAKPPGKEPRSISQLSGGERTLTAVALLMAIFRSKPSCFCILDEVDAALDEVNVGRYCTTVRSFTDMSSFIVITHNKRTMQMADHIYGITQQERGISKRVSVRFDHVASDGSFDAEKAEPEPTREPASQPKPARTKDNRPSGALRKALAKMHDEDQPPVRVNGENAAR